MKTRILPALLLAAAANGAVADDNVRASFDRMLNHAPYAGATVVSAGRGECDIAEDMIRSAQRTPAYHTDSITANLQQLFDRASCPSAAAIVIAPQQPDSLEPAVRNAHAGEPS